MEGRVLIVEDDASIREVTALGLRRAGFRTGTAVDGRDGLAVWRGAEFDLIILDVMLPGIDGVTVCRAIRRDSPNSDTPILMLTARRDESDKVLGLDSGADDYLTKPFGVRELMARVRALLRRRPGDRPSQDATSVVRYKHITLDPARRTVKVAGKDVELTWHEFQLLHTLTSNPGIVFSRDALLRKVWKDETFVTERSVDTLVKRVRKKIEEDPANPTVLLTVWGSGYKVADVA